MKKFICIAFLATCVALCATAQRATISPLVAGDTVVNAATVSKIITVSAGYESFTIQPVITKISGTVGGSCFVLASHDGVNYFPVSDTITLANATVAAAGKATWSFAPDWTYYKVQTVGSGTMAAVVRLWTAFRQYATNR